MIRYPNEDYQETMIQRIEKQEISDAWNCRESLEDKVILELKW